MTGPVHLLCIIACLQSQRGDLDMNQHVNNLKYISWLFEVPKYYDPHSSVLLLSSIVQVVAITHTKASHCVK